MMNADNCKYVLLVPPQLKDDGDFAGNTYVDVAGWGLAEFIFIVGTLDAAIGSTAEGNAPKIEECDTTGGSYTDVTDAALADAIADDEDDSLFRIKVNMIKSHKRYMRVNPPHAGDGTNGANAAVLCRLSRPIGNGPVSAAQRGLVEDIAV